jgi:prepilin signal peptidase PulO-like enzyme (type II secretory pathway)
LWRSFGKCGRIKKSKNKNKIIMEIAILLIFFMFGAAMGSFLNVVAVRTRKGTKFTTGRSKCPKCKKIIRWYDNIPILSYLILRGVCRKCKKEISWQYPAAEIGTGILFSAVAFKFFSLMNSDTFIPTVFWLILVSLLVVIFIYDAKYLEIPGGALWSALVGVIIFNLISDFYSARTFLSVFELATYSGTLAGMAGFLFFFFLVAVSDERWMGMGDAYLALLLGLLLGWPKILLGLFLAFMLGSFWGIVLIITKKKTMQSQIPFGPFLITGALLAVFFFEFLSGKYMAFF